MGIPTACLISLNRHKGLSNYHSPTDVPENLSYATIACATDLAEAVTRRLAPPG
jgi:Iap family predicted aminopeptidase